MLHNTLILFRYASVNLTAATVEARAMKQLPKDLHDAVIGMLLGDAGAYRTSSSLTSNTRLEFSFGSGRELFAEYVGILFALYCNTPVSSLMVAATVNGVLHKSFRLKTVALPLFNNTGIYSTRIILLQVRQ